MNYFDNASTSFPKPREVEQAVVRYLREGGTYSRAAYGRVVNNTRVVELCRDYLSQILGVSNGDNIAFSSSATMSANTLIKGIGLNGIVYVSALEHNAIMRPLYALENIQVEILPHDTSGRVDIETLKTISTDGVSLVFVNHESNVNGVIQPIEQIKKWAGGTPLAVDATQSLGAVEFCAEKWGVDYVIFAGHKSLLGPTGIGGFYAKDMATVETFIHGGTGSNSESYYMPTHSPDRMEAGTPNIMGIYGLLAALENRPVPQHTKENYTELLTEVSKIDGMTLYSGQGELFSITHHNLAVAEICEKLYGEFGIETRSGLHCAPLAHRTLGTFPSGTVRIAPSPYHTAEDFKYLLNAFKSIV